MRLIVVVLVVLNLHHHHRPTTKPVRPPLLLLSLDASGSLVKPVVVGLSVSFVVSKVIWRLAATAASSVIFSASATMGKATRNRLL
jgi:hypothetical protein